jgi:hypothetical protein
MFCSNGHALNAGQKFCPECGAPASAAVAPPAEFGETLVAVGAPAPDVEVSAPVEVSSTPPATSPWPPRPMAPVSAPALPLEKVDAPFPQRPTPVEVAPIRQRRSKGGKWGLIGVAVVTVLTLVGLLLPKEEKPAAKVTAPTTRATSLTPAEPLAAPTLASVGFVLAKGEVSIANATSVATIAGRSDPGAQIEFSWDDGESKATAGKDGRFAAKIGPLPFGETEVTVVANIAGKLSVSDFVTVTRTMSSSYYKSLAKSFSYDKLNKDPDALAGRIVTYRAEVMQYDARTGTDNMLVNVTADEYGYWDDLVFLTLDGAAATSIDEDDIIQFWGEVTGAYSYDTAIGGSNTVPEIEIKYIKLIKKIDS